MHDTSMLDGRAPTNKLAGYHRTFVDYALELHVVVLTVYTGFRNVSHA